MAGLIRTSTQKGPPLSTLQNRQRGKLQIAREHRFVSRLSRSRRNRSALTRATIYHGVEEGGVVPWPEGPWKEGGAGDGALREAVSALEHMVSSVCGGARWEPKSSGPVFSNTYIIYGVMKCFGIMRDNVFTADIVVLRAFFV
eukprot:4743400-Pyramimonas_sp.AAC.2